FAGMNGVQAFRDEQAMVPIDIGIMQDGRSPIEAALIRRHERLRDRNPFAGPRREILLLDAALARLKTRPDQSVAQLYRRADLPQTHSGLLPIHSLSLSAILLSSASRLAFLPERPISFTIAKPPRQRLTFLSSEGINVSVVCADEDHPVVDG